MARVSGPNGCQRLRRVQSPGRFRPSGSRLQLRRQYDSVPFCFGKQNTSLLTPRGEDPLWPEGRRKAREQFGIQRGRRRGSLRNTAVAPSSAGRVDATVRRSTARSDAPARAACAVSARARISRVGALWRRHAGITQGPPPPVSRPRPWLMGPPNGGLPRKLIGPRILRRFDPDMS